jgi:uncharacterized membrane protein YphA (DoxX/SURF4 family)
MSDRRKHQILTFLIATVWLINGLVCKVLNVVPRHQEIIGSILGEDYSRALTILIGVSEIVMAAWIVSGLWTRLNTIIQIFVIGTMNTLEFYLVPDMLLWGKLNSVWAFVFIILIWYNGFRLNEKPQPA